MKEQDAFIEQFQAALGITWQVNQVYSNVGEVTVASSKSDHLHQLTIPFGEFPLEAYKTDIALLLAKAKLGESRDPLFSTIRFRPEYDIDDPNFRERAYMVHSAQQVTDVWGMDLVKANLGNDLAREDIDSWLGLARQIPNESIQELGLSYFLGFASKMGLMRRFGYTDLEPMFAEETARLSSLVTKEGLAQVMKISDYYQHLPELSKDSDTAIKQLEQATQDMTQLISLPIHLSIVTINGDHVWQIE